MMAEKPTLAVIVVGSEGSIPEAKVSMSSQVGVKIVVVRLGERVSQSELHATGNSFVFNISVIILYL